MEGMEQANTLSKQEEIREGLKNLVSNITEGGEDGDELREDDWDGSWADGILKYLHSQGVVIKVDRELPEFSKRWDEDGHIFHDAIVPVTRGDLAEAGYVAVEPLIEVCEHEWIKLRNEVITSGEICTKCKAIRPEAGESLIRRV